VGTQWIRTRNHEHMHGEFMNTSMEKLAAAADSLPWQFGHNPAALGCHVFSYGYAFNLISIPCVILECTVHILSRGRDGVIIEYVVPGWVSHLFFSCHVVFSSYTECSLSFTDLVVLQVSARVVPQSWEMGLLIHVWRRTALATS